NIAPWLGYVFSVIILLGIYSTAAPMLWTVADQFPIKSRRTYTILCLALTVVALIGALKLPFAELVGFVYPSIGYFGLVFFGMLAYRQISLRLRSNEKEERKDCPPFPKERGTVFVIGSGGRIRTYDLWVMSPASYRAAPPR